MAGFPQVGDCMAWARGNAKTSTRHIAKISIALINIPLGNYCLVRQRATQAIFSEGQAFFSERNSDSFAAPAAPATRRNAKHTAKHGKCAQRLARNARCPTCSRKRRVKSIFTLPLHCNDQSVVWSRVADSVA
jgi:hypothetical protein